MTDTAAIADQCGADRHTGAGWNPEDRTAWDDRNRAIARRNLIWATLTSHLAYSIWSLWSVLVLFMPVDVYGLRTGDKLLLTATATLIGGAVRIPYVAATRRFGGRNWTVWSTLVLLIPTAGTVALLADPGRPLWMYLVCAALTGLGGGNYAAALADVETLYPQRLKGVALGVAGGVGNLGVAAIQLVGLLVLATTGPGRPYWVGGVYLVLLVLAAAGAAARMDNLDAGARGGQALRPILTLPDTWVITALYTATFGSFIGFAFAFAQVLHVTFLEAGQSHAQAALHAAAFAFVGPLLGAVARVYGGRLADRHGGPRVTLAVLVGAVLASGALLIVGDRADRHPDTISAVELAGYLAGFITLFVLAGIGNAAVMKMIPALFAARSRDLPGTEAHRRAWAGSRSAALIGLATTVGALGGVAINLALRQAYAVAGTETPAFGLFCAAYLAAAALTYLRYLRPHRDAHLTASGRRPDESMES